VLRTLPLDTVASQGYCFQVDLVWRAWRAGFKVVEVPITFVERTLGQSKMSRSIVAEAFWRVMWWGVRSGPKGRRPGAPVTADATGPAATPKSAAAPAPPKMDKPPSPERMAGDEPAKRR
jgi:apolipoprotein N-acyltransferase